MPGVDAPVTSGTRRTGADASIPDAGPVVEIEEISKRFPVRRSWRETLLHPLDVEYQDALHGITFQVGRGEFFGLLGRNGAGKTTLFKILATLVLPDAGSARVVGADVTIDPASVRRRLVPVIPYERSLYWRLSARENLDLYAALHGYGRGEARRRVDRILEVVGLADVGSKQVGLFSSGMKQRLLTARALLSEPDVLLLDEPTRSLDPVTARDLRRFLREEVNQRQGCTVLLATHDADEVRELCHTVGILEEGRLLVTGSTGELLTSVGGRRYRLLGRGPIESVLGELQGRGVVAGVEVSDPEGEWVSVDMDVLGDRDEAARILAGFVRSGVEVASFTRTELSLAELIETVVDRAGIAERGTDDGR